MSDINEALKLIFPLSYQTIIPATNRVIYYDFPTSYPGNSVLDPNFVDTPLYSAIADWSSVHNQGFTQKLLDMFDAIEAVTGISFQQAPEGQQPNLSIGFYDRAISSGVFLGEAVPGAQPDTAYVMLGGSSAATGIFNSETPFFLNTVLHEVGHTLGLGHPFDPNTLLNAGAERTNQYTVMAYDSHPEYGGPLGVGDPQSTWSTGLMLYDIAALQSLYGANTHTNSGNTHYGASNNSQLGGDWTNNVVVVETIWDPSGDADVFDTSNQSGRVVLDLRQGEFSSIGQLPGGGAAVDNIAIAFDSIVEQAIGGGANDIVIGNSAKNDLDGGAGDDWLLGDGFRLVDVDSHADKNDFDAILGTVVKPIDHDEYYQGQYWSIPQDSDDDTLHGGDGADHVFGGAGNDTIDGGADNDQLYGDSYPLIVDDSTAPAGTRNDTIFGDDGNDTVVGGVGDDSLSGGIGSDSILGDAEDFIGENDHGKDILLGGDGADTLYGGGNDDSLDGGSGGDVLYGSSPDKDVAALPGNDTLNGGDGNDQLFGGAGSDSLFGGTGDDTLTGGVELDAYGDADIFYGGDGKDVFVCWGADEIRFPESNETLTVDGMTPSGGTWQYIGKQPDANEESGYLEIYGWVGQYGEIYSPAFGDVDGKDVYCLSIQFYDRVGENPNDWNMTHAIGIAGWEDDVGFMGINLDDPPWGAAAMLNIEDVLGGNTPGIAAVNGDPASALEPNTTEPLAGLMPTPSMPELQPAMADG